MHRSSSSSSSSNDREIQSIIHEETGRSFNGTFISDKKLAVTRHTPSLGQMASLKAILPMSRDALTLRKTIAKST
jgi:hypothetical protein